MKTDNLDEEDDMLDETALQQKLEITDKIIIELQKDVNKLKKQSKSASLASTNLNQNNSIKKEKNKKKFVKYDEFFDDNNL